MDSFEGYEWYGEWLLAEKHRAWRKWVIETPPPRVYGVLDQLRVEVRAPTVLFVYSLGLVLVILSAVTRTVWLFLLGVAFLWYFARNFPDLLEVSRRGVLATTTVSRVEFVFTGNRGVTSDASVADRTMNVGFEADIVRAMIERHSRAELLVIYDPRALRQVAHSVGYRAPRADAGEDARLPAGPG